MEKISHYCQKCRAANPVGERNCRHCGTRLMIVVFPPALRHDEGIVPTFYEDHLLERVSLLELQLAQAIEKIGMITQFFAREAKELKKDQKFIRAFSDALKDANPQLAEELNRTEGDNKNEAEETRQSENAQNRFINDILTRHEQPNAPLFSHLLHEGIRLLEAKEERQAFQMLERAALLSPQNAALLAFVGESFYRADKINEAKKYLEQAFESAPNDEKVLLLLGTIYADAGEAEKGRKFLSVLANDEETSLLVHFEWGLLAASEANWTESLAAFRQALTSAPQSAELNYLVGCVYFQLERPDAALQFFRKATRADRNFSDARFMQSVIYKIRGDEVSEKQALAGLTEKMESGAQCSTYLSGKKQVDEQQRTALPFQHLKGTKKNLLTGGAPRLNRFFREQILRAIELKTS
ncbi:MAG: tetratricopeptide repeat protein [Acidobacteria bacterium]|nr:tetratricopeptide repeat protein [Acidobacteriota bacterium]